MERQQFNRLLDKYLRGGATAAEESLLAEYYRRLEKNAPVELAAAEEEALRGLMLRQIMGQVAPARVRPLYWRYAAAASLLLVSVISGYFYWHRGVEPVQVAINKPIDISPAANSAILTLANGRKVYLTEHTKGKVASEAGAVVNQAPGGQLQYQADALASKAQEISHTLTTLRHDKYHLILADGTEAYLDAESSITFPVAFTQKERRVSVTGQVYFRVKHDAAHPFIVNAQNQTIEDIGTEFNVTAYPDESKLKTTLVQGEVKVTHLNKTIDLKPGEQTVVENNTITKVSDADIEAATAWMQGKLVFHNETLESLMKKIARIYDVQVIWKDDMRKELFGGGVTISKKLSSVLDYLREAGKADFKLEGKTVTVFRKKQSTHK